MKRLLAISDLHCGAKVGLTPPGWIKPDTVPTQFPLWSWYETTVRDIGKVDILLVNGDAVDGDGHKDSIGLITTDTEEQATMAGACIKQINFDQLFMTYGTPYHTAGSYSFENLIAKEFDCLIKDTIFLEVEGVKFSFRHTTGSAGTPYTQGTQIMKEAVRDLLEAVQGDSESADITVRAHVHNYYRVENAHRQALTLPCLQVPDSVYGRKCRSWYYDIGMVLFEIDGEEVKIKPYIMPLKIVKKREYIKV